MTSANNLPDYYELLGVTPDADEAQIRDAHKELGKTAHPDLGGNAALYRLITVARDTLVDPERRAAYDRSRIGTDEPGTAAAVPVSAGTAGAEMAPVATAGAGAVGAPEPEPAGAEPAGAEPAGAEPAGGRNGRRPGLPPRNIALPVGGVVVVGVAVAAFFVFGASGSGSPKRPKPATTTTSTSKVTAATPKPKTPGTTTFTDAADGFSVSYPKAWQQVSTPNAPFQAQIPGSQDAMRVQVFQLQKAVDTSNVSDIKAVTDAIVSQSGKIEFQSPLTVNKMVGYYYQNLYLTPTKQEGSQSLYFFFQGRKMSVLTFQSLPYSDFDKLGSTFVQVVDSYKSNPAILGPVPIPAPVSTPTTAKPGTAPTTTPTTSKQLATTTTVAK